MKQVTSDIYPPKKFKLQILMDLSYLYRSKYSNNIYNHNNL